MGRWPQSGRSPGNDYDDSHLVAEPQQDANRQATNQGAAFLALVGLVLLIACANIANLTLARGEGRRREMSLRVALGATRFDLFGQIILESAVVAVAGAAVGVVMASWLIHPFPALLPPGASSIMLDVRVDRRLLGFTAVLACLTTALVGLVPA